MNRTAGIVVIGNEILSGKVTDTNSSFLTRELRAMGVDVRRISVIPDDLDDIARTVRRFHETFDLVFTSGGVGPTHDDITIEGIARAFERRVVREPELERKLRDFYKEKVNDARLKMSEVPEGAELIYGGTLAFPTLKVENVYILPGIPEILQSKFLGDPRALCGGSLPSPHRLHARGRRSDRAASERDSPGIPRAPARLVPEDRRPGVHGEGDARIEGL